MDASDRPSGIRDEPGLVAYRPFIDGLRAVSILAVVLYHIGVPGFTGGYVGVDVFFVISGFLIINQIADRVGRENFSFGEFWARRALRILPPYFLVLVFAMAAAPFVLVMPDEFRQFSREVGHAAAMVVNHLFLLQQGYFDADSDAKILLHLWSLAVEEQFYLVAPCLIVSIWWLSRRARTESARKRVILCFGAAIFVLSLAGCILFTAEDGGRNYAFYVTGLRAWEFIAGGAVGLLLPLARRLPAPAQPWLAACGLAAILATFFLYDDQTPFPSWRALVPVAGAVAVICGGIAFHRTQVIRLLSSPGMVGVGLVSYSWYLWHWPLLALGRNLQLGQRSFTLDLALGLISFGFAVATFRLVERPLRRWRQRRDKPLGWRPVFAAVGLCAVVSVAGESAFSTVGKQIAAAAAAQNPPASATPPTFCDLQTAAARDCANTADGRPFGLLIGDSHALAARNRLAARAERDGTLLISAASGGCMRFAGMKVFIPDQALATQCEALESNAQTQLSSGLIRPSYAILYARWPIYGTTRRTYRLGATGASQPESDQPAAFIAGVRGLVGELRNYGVERILVLGPTPRFPRPAPACLYLAQRYGRNIDRACGVGRPRAEAEGRDALERLKSALADLPDVRLIEPLDDFCDGTRCLPFAGDEILLLDTNHLSDAGTDRLIDAHKGDFDWLTGVPDGHSSASIPAGSQPVLCGRRTFREKI